LSKTGSFLDLDGNQARALTSFIVARLSEAADIAYERLYFRVGEMSVGMREAIAFSLCARLDVFAFRDPAVGLVRLARNDYLQHGCFARRSRCKRACLSCR
jgi:hypothetical protein